MTELSTHPEIKMLASSFDTVLKPFSDKDVRIDMMSKLVKAAIGHHKKEINEDGEVVVSIENKRSFLYLKDLLNSEFSMFKGSNALDNVNSIIYTLVRTKDGEIYGSRSLIKPFVDDVLYTLDQDCDGKDNIPDMSIKDGISKDDVEIFMFAHHNTHVSKGTKVTELIIYSFGIQKDKRDIIYTEAIKEAFDIFE